MRLIAAWFVLITFSIEVAAQAVTGSVTGVVLDSAGAAIQGAPAKLISITTGAVREAVTSGSGEFVINAVLPGEYTLRIEHPGFQRFELTGLNIIANDAISVGDIRLKLSGVSEQVTVSAIAEGAMVQTASGERSGIITANEVENLTVINRDFAALLTLMPGVVETPGVETQGYGGNSQFNVQGSRVSANNVTLDGVPTDGNDFLARNFYVSMDSISTVKVLTSNYQAEFGRKPGSGVMAVTKSGSLKYHGAGYFYKRHEQFNAVNFFNNRNGVAPTPYRFNTMGFNLGGPLRLPFRRGDPKWFFFVSLESLPERRPQPIRQVTFPTERERAADFSDSRDLNGALIVVRDPLNKTAFPNNVVPASRVNSAMRNYLNLLPLPNGTDIALTARRYNYQIQESLDIPKQTETARLDRQVNDKTSVYARFNYWWEDLRGFAVPGGNSNWGWLPASYCDPSVSIMFSGTHIASPSLIFEGSFGFTWRPVAGSALNQSDLRRLNRTTAGVNIPQFHPEMNTYNLVPEASFSGVTGAAAVSYENRFPLMGDDKMFNWNASLTKTHGTHVSKLGVAIDHRESIHGPNANFAGTFNFGRNTSNPNDSNHPYANALLGNFASYTESTARPTLYGWANGVEWFAQDNWKVSRRLTLDFGSRFGWSQPPHSPSRNEAGFVPSLWDPAKRVQLIGPVAISGVRQGRDPVTGQLYPAVAIGAFAPNSGDPFNGTVNLMVDKNYPGGLRNSSGPKFVPRFGFAYDPFGKGKTAIRGGFGVFYEMFDRNNFNTGIYTNPPLRQDPIVEYGSLDSFISSGSLVFPSATTGMNLDRKLERIMNYSFGLQQNIGFGTVVDASYVGSLGRHLLQRSNLNAIPFGTTFLPSSRDTTQSGNNALPAAFLRPYIGYNNIMYYVYQGNSSYHSLQVTVNRRFARRLQYGAAWTWSKSMDYADTNEGNVSSLISRRVWDYGESGFDRTHILKLFWTWDAPALSHLWRNPVMRAVGDGWQLSGITTFMSGAPQAFSVTLTGTTDITGSPTDSARPVVLSNPNLPKSERSFNRNFRTEAFGPPVIGTFGNAPRNVVRGPGINNWDMSAFKRIPLPWERSKLQFRMETYNTFNHTQFSDFDTTARFDAQGRQTNAAFGQFTAARPARRLQLALRLTF